MELEVRRANSNVRLVVEVLVWSSGEARGGDVGRNFASKAGGYRGVREISEEAMKRGMRPGDRALERTEGTK